MERTDAALVELCLADRKDAFEVLVERHKDRVFRFALRITGDRDDAADVAQETFVRAYRKLALYDGERSFGNWLLAICANLAKNRLRSEGRRRRAQEAHVEIYQSGREPPDPLRAALEDALRRMPEALRLPLVLKHMEGLSYEEVADVLGIRLSAAKMRVKRARDELARRLAAEAEGNR